MEEKGKNAKYRTRILKCPLCRFLDSSSSLHCINSINDSPIVESCGHLAERKMVIIALNQFNH